VGAPEPEQMPRRRLDPLLRRDRRALEVLGVRERHLGHADPLDRRAETAERLIRLAIASGPELTLADAGALGPPGVAAPATVVAACRSSSARSPAACRPTAPVDHRELSLVRAHHIARGPRGAFPPHVGDGPPVVGLMQKAARANDTTITAHAMPTARSAITSATPVRNKAVGTPYRHSFRDRPDMHRAWRHPRPKAMGCWAHLR